MKILELNRIGENEDTTFSVLSYITRGNNVMPICNILENGWKENKANISCIPKGSYPLQRGTTNKPTTNGETFQVMGVARRTLIKFHIGNTHYDTLGCMLTISEFGWLTVKGASILGGYESRKAFARFMDVMAREEEAVLNIK